MGNASDKEIHWKLQPISVLMPAYNAGSTITKAVSSTLRSMNQVSELLILLDGCTDNTRDELDKFSDARIRLIVQTKNQGLSISLNRLISESNFEFLARIDADDITLPWRLKCQHRLMQKNKSDFEFSNVISFGKTLRFGFRYNFLRKRLNPKDSRVELLVKNPFVHSTAFMRKSAVDELGGYRASAAEDYDLWLRASAAGYSLSRSRLVSVLYRIHPNQISTSEDWLRALSVDPFLKESYSLLQSQINHESNLRYHR
jgi:glycosyltransferase involved in cell wall biosynthesis